MVDHQLPNFSVLCWSKWRNASTALSKVSDFLAIGWMEQHDLQTELIFQHLTHRNAINFCANKSMAGVVIA
jgi:hypothetical protein